MHFNVMGKYYVLRLRLTHASYSCYQRGGAVLDPDRPCSDVDEAFEKF